MQAVCSDCQLLVLAGTLGALAMRVTLGWDGVNASDLGMCGTGNLSTYLNSSLILACMCHEQFSVCVSQVRTALDICG